MHIYSLFILLFVAVVSTVGFPSIAQAASYPQRVNVASDGTQANDSGQRFESLDISADGRYVVYSSFATNLVPNDTNGVADIFLYDRQTLQTTRVSVASDGSQANDRSGNPSISPNGRYIVYNSGASNLVANDTNGFFDAFLYDQQTGVTERVSVASDGSEPNEGIATAAVSSDGRYVSFSTIATNLVANDTNNMSDVFVHDRQTGVTERVSVASDGSEGNNGSSNAAINADGRYVTFQSSATNMVTNDTNGVDDMFRHDRQTGTTELVSAATDGTIGDLSSLFNAITADGRYIVFTSESTNLVPDTTNNQFNAFVKDMQTGAIALVSKAPDGTLQNGRTYRVGISDDGGYVVFGSFATNLVPDDTNNRMDVFVTRNPFVAPPDPVTVSFNASEDTYVRSGTANRNLGGGVFMRVQAGSNRSLVRFDQSVMQSSISGEVLSAKLRVMIVDNGNGWGATGRTIDAHRLITNWVEGTGTENANGTGSGATWNCAIDSNISNSQKNCTGVTEWEMGMPNNPLVHPWIQTASATQTITNNQSGVVEFDVTGDVASFLDGTNQNYGWIIKKTDSNSGNVSFGTKESASVPQLVVTYQP